MKLYDQHVHSSNSVDADADPAEVIDQAIKMGLAGVTFTEHYDCHPIERPLCIYNYTRIADTVAALKERFAGQIDIGLGIEVCFQPDHMDQVLKHLDSCDFDLVLLSIHWFEGRALHYRDHWETISPQEATQSYLRTVLQAVQFALELNRRGRSPFQVLAHLDLVKRYTQRYFNYYDITPYRDLLDEILQTCILAGLVLELNCSTWRQSLAEPMPADWTIQRYAELGGQAMTIGSDAHHTPDVGTGLDRGVETMKEAGIQYQAVFMNRQRYDIPLNQTASC